MSLRVRKGARVEVLFLERRCVCVSVSMRDGVFVKEKEKECLFKCLCERESACVLERKCVCVCVVPAQTVCEGGGSQEVALPVDGGPVSPWAERPEGRGRAGQVQTDVPERVYRRGNAAANGREREAR